MTEVVGSVDFCSTGHSEIRRR